MPEAFEPSRQELLGDVYLAKNDSENAKKAYLAAWDVLRERQENRAVLALKLQSLGVTVEPIEVPMVVANDPANNNAVATTEASVVEQVSEPADTQTTQSGNP